MIRTLFHKQYYKILKVFYDNRNTPIHLRQISRLINLKESSTSLHLNNLTKNKILTVFKDANLKKYQIQNNVIPKIFSIFDIERLESLPLLRKNCVKEYLSKLKSKPLLLILFGSTSKGNYKSNSDIDLLQVSGSKNFSEAKESAESISGLNLQIFRFDELKFYQKKDHIILSALESGFPVFNREFFYEIISSESFVERSTRIGKNY